MANISSQYVMIQSGYILSDADGAWMQQMEWYLVLTPTSKSFQSACTMGRGGDGMSWMAAMSTGLSGRGLKKILVVVSGNDRRMRGR